MAGKRRRADSVDIINRQALLYKLKAIKSKRNAALAAFIYLTGCRISEIVGKTKKAKQGPVEIRPLQVDDIEVLPNEGLVLVHNVACLKRRDEVPRRTIPIVIETEREFIAVFDEYFKHLQPGQPIFKITRQRAWQIMNKELGLFTHFLIHERCTHLVSYKGFTDLDLKQFRGWSNTVPAATYTHLNYRDIAAKMR